MSALRSACRCFFIYAIVKNPRKVTRYGLLYPYKRATRLTQSLIALSKRGISGAQDIRHSPHRRAICLLLPDLRCYLQSRRECLGVAVVLSRHLGCTEGCSELRVRELLF